MIIAKFPTEQTARMMNGDIVRYDRLETHDDLRLFFRGAIGLVYSTHKDNVLSYTGNENNNGINSTAGPAGGERAV